MVELVAAIRNACKDQMVLRFEGAERCSDTKHPAFLAYEVFNHSDSLAAATVVKSYLFRLRWQFLAERENSLRQWMSYPVRIDIIDSLAEAIGTRVNPLTFKRVPLQHERVPALVEAGIGAEIEAGYLPEPLLKAIEIVAAADADLFDNFLVEIIQELLPRFFSFVVDLGFEVLLELIELEADLLRCTAFLVNGNDPLFEIDAGLDGAEHLVAGSEDAIEKAKFFVEKLIDPHVGGIASVEEVDDHDIELLAVPVAPADALLDALRIPGKVVVDDQVAELQVDPLGGCFGRNHDERFVAEVFDEGGTLIGGGRIRDLVSARMTFQPCPINLF